MRGHSKSTIWFHRAIDTYQRPLTRYLRNILKNLESAKEIVQEVFLRLWKNGPIEFESPMRIWIYKVGRHLAIDHLRKEGRVNPFNEGEEFALLCPDSLPEEKVEFKQFAGRILEIVEDLPAKYQEVLRLKFQEELSYKEMAEITGMSANHVGVLLHQAILHLRQAVKKEVKNG